MQPGKPTASLRLEAETETVEDLVGLVTRGSVRVPAFQRGLRWEGEDVVALFDSIYRGYPVGSVLLRKGRAGAARIMVGPLAIDAPETEAALWVVDGQQRLTALAAGLSRPTPIPKSPDDPWVVYFDAATQEFQRPSRDDGHIPSTWVPVAQLLDASALIEWVFHWQHAADQVLRTAVFQAGSLIRQYRIPLYVVETDDEQKLRDIFYRINNFGKSLEWGEVHDALFGHRGNHPSTLRELAEELQRLGMGRPEEETLLSCLVAFKGLDVTRNIAEHYRKDSKVLAGAVQESLPAVRRVLSFLKLHAEIPHLRLLPRSIPLVVLTRFFALYPEPKARTLTLLVRWTWRLLLGGAGSYDERTVLRHGVTAIQDSDEEKTSQALLSLVPKERRDPYVLPRRFDARAADSRIALLGMASLSPRDLKDESPIDVAVLIEQHGVAAFRRIFPGGEGLGQGPANRMLLAGSGAARRDVSNLILLQLVGDLESPVLLSHAIPPRAAEALSAGDEEGFLIERKTAVEDAVNRLGERLAAWSRSDRPTIGYLLEQSEIEA
ncbi:MAG TPA: DUF262 domain-containing protein [Thermoanaerobaculia bacterium]|jgi:hypothetical protein|nr:DUF262 domain-containing protein [Thermoanaerobaculia bacterium]